MKIENCKIFRQINSKKAAFYPYDPTQDASYLQRYHYLKNRTYLRNQLVDVLRSYHSPELLHPKIEWNLQRLASSESVVVIGGQQAGLLTGPLYTIYKAISIIQLAKREEARLKKPVIPVFWIAGEDHDLHEVDHLYLPLEVSMKKKLFPINGNNRASISSIELSPDIIKFWLEQLSQDLGDSEHKAEWVTLIQSLTNEPISWTRFFARILHYLFAPYGLLLIDSYYPKLRELEKPFFEQLIDHNEVLGEAVHQGIKNWEKVGQAAPLQFEENQAHLFIEYEGSRVGLYREGTSFRSRNHFIRYSKEELHAKYHKLSNNVATRPIMQEMVFPVLAFVGGSAEIDYWGCLGEAFQLFHLEPPIIYPRNSITIVERGIEKYRQNWGISWEQLLAGEGKAIIERWKKENFPVQIQDQFTQFTKQINSLYEPFIKELSDTIGGNIAYLGKSNQQRMIRQLEWLEKKALEQISKQQESSLRQQFEVVNAVYPLGDWQERSYNLVYYWNEYGLDWLHMLSRQDLPEVNSHQLLFF